MVFTSFIVSFVCLILFIFVKIWEEETNKIIISKNALSKSDAVLKKGLLRFFNYYLRISSKTASLPEISSKTKSKINFWLVKRRDKIATKVIHALNINNIKDIERNKGSVSLFLKTISEDKKINK